MARYGLSKEACDETLTYLRTHLPQVDDALLQELAGDFAWVALADLDPAEFWELLDVPGPKITLRGSIQNDEAEAIKWNALFPTTLVPISDLSIAASALLVIRTGSKRPFNVFSALADLIRTSLHPAAVIGSALYEDLSLGSKTSVLLVLSGVGTSSETLDARWREMQTRPKIDVEMDHKDLPAFLRK